ncbi:hypothetical protein AQUCO_00200535v1 [Aquilegia coerulea]|uniref:Uncharacterized protein n=1 Tax=Aquilegia coerulea TaxID=218851 RepID=A0A2G5F3L2_AQUCA|nr:hypothetical protein AQUCO_00200535v1 [Aquilegia coerulea]
MASHFDKLSKVDQLLQVAAAGNLRRMKKLAKELDDGRGIAETLANSKDSHGRAVIHVAAQKGRTEICKYLIEELKLHVDEKDHEADYTPLLRATCEGHVRTVAYLIEHGANPAAFNRHNKTALHIAVDNGFVEMIKLLLSKGVDVNAPCDEGTPLQLAAQNCKQNILKVLLDHGANPNPVVTLIPTPLMWAISGNSMTCIKLLIQRGADPNAVAHGHTPLALACCGKKFDIIKCLLESGLKPIEIAAQNANLAEVGILFPVTSPIPACSDWSINGIMKYMHSEEARQQELVRNKEILLKVKSEADRALQRKDYFLAQLHYIEVLKLDPLDATALSNSSLCYTCQGYPELALEDAQACIKIRPDWPEAYYRAGVALTALEEFDMAADTLLEGLKLDRENKELRDAFQKAVEGKLNSVNI